MDSTNLIKCIIDRFVQIYVDISGQWMTKFTLYTEWVSKRIFPLKIWGDGCNYLSISLTAKSARLGRDQLYRVSESEVGMGRIVFSCWIPDNPATSCNTAMIHHYKHNLNQGRVEVFAKDLPGGGAIKMDYLAVGKNGKMKKEKREGKGVEKCAGGKLRKYGKMRFFQGNTPPPWAKEM